MNMMVSMYDKKDKQKKNSYKDLVSEIKF